MRKKAIPFLLILLVCTLLAACGEGADNTDTTTAPITSTVSTAVTTTVAPVTTTVTTTAAVTTTAPITTTVTTTAATTTAPVTTEAPRDPITPEALLDAANAALLAEEAPYRAAINGTFLSNSFLYAPLLSGIRLEGEARVGGTDATLTLSFVGLEVGIGTVGEVAYARYPQNGVTERYRAAVNEAQKADLLAGIALPAVELSAFSEIEMTEGKSGTTITCREASDAVIDGIGDALAYAAPHMPSGITLTVSDVRLSILIAPDGRYKSITVMADCTAKIGGIRFPTVLKVEYLLQYESPLLPTLPTDIEDYTEIDYDELIGGLAPDGK